MAKKKKGTGVLVFAIVFVMIALIAGGAYAGIAYYFRSHFYPQSTINGKNIALSDSERVTEILKEGAEDFLLAVHDRDERVTYINAKDIDYTYVDDHVAASLLKKQDSMKWPLYINQKHDYEVPVETTYSVDKLIAVVKAMPCFDEENIVEPKDAYMVFEDGLYEIVKEEPGSTPLEEQIILDVENAVSEKAKVLKLTEADYVQPKVTADDPSLQEKMEVVQKYRDMTITYEIDGYDEVLEGDTIMSWITINEDLTVDVDENMLAVYAQKLASTYNTYAMKRSFKTSLGDTIVIGGGDYGWIVAKQREAAQLLEDIKKGESVTRKPCWEQEAFVGGRDDLGKTYIELDYTNQHLYYYRKGKLKIESDFVSGNLNNGNGSPDGVFKIIDRKQNVTLYGEDYESDVTFFMPFAYNVGLHDASWRSSFGGNIYKGGGSHGCINLPADVAEKIFDKIKLGTPVIAYYREDVKLTSNNAKVSNAFSYTSGED